MEFLDDFKVEGPNGTHQCIVTEVLGPGLNADPDELYDEGQFPIGVAKTMILQVARGVAYLHGCGVVHGDLHAGNILFRIPTVEQMSYQDLAVYLGEPYERPLTRRDRKPVISTPHQPKYVVPSSEMLDLLPLCLDSQESIQLKICDFGKAFLCGDKPQKIQLNTLAVYAAPEITFRDYVSPATDVWALAILIRIILRGGFPFFFSYYEMKKEVLREMVATLGKLPDKWWTKWEDRSEYFDENGMFIVDKKISPAASRNFLSIPSNWMDEEELNELEIIVRKMVPYELTDRISATEVVRLLSESWTKSRHQRI
ncbi:kinase-like domain-containing protein [Collybia nuda]|uniref:Kinase-like domain-containing protein n=1 Tax=Collybia nuda TaxID=64659 RepID=A0A9P6CKD9_9AGAR|nr:kinase-like domain-containing protein [Collybia nuda]